MTVDVSPDGQTIVFDLLGDIYTLPIAGGDATAISAGVAWDMQPRFSPDGQWIAFTSDRGGGDNIWIMKRDGTEPKQVSKESFRLVNSPAWSPDGECIAGRKHFTAERSLGQRRDLALPPERRRRPADDREAERPEGRRRAGLLARRALRLLQPGHDAGRDLRVQQGLERPDLRHPPPRPRDRQDRATSSTAPAARCARRRRPTASASPSSAACASSRCSSCRTSPPASSSRSTPSSTATCRRPGRSTASTRRWAGRRTARALVFWAGGKIHRLSLPATLDASRPRRPVHVAATADEVIPSACATSAR